MILFDKIISTGIEYCVVAQCPYQSINMLSIDNKGGERGILINFIFIFFVTKHMKISKKW